MVCYKMCALASDQGWLRHCQLLHGYTVGLHVKINHVCYRKPPSLRTAESNSIVMVLTCCVLGCFSQGKHNNVSFHSIPCVIVHQGMKVRELSTKRRCERLAKINQGVSNRAKWCSRFLWDFNISYRFQDLTEIC